MSNNCSISISDFAIDKSKIFADGKTYFNLFEKHVPKNLGADSTVCLYKLDNASCISRLMMLNPEAHYVVVGNKEVSNCVSLATVESLNNVEYLEDFSFETTRMTFDCIIMNPPYQRNLHLKILAEAIKHLRDEKSVCVNLSPFFMRKNELKILADVKKFLFMRILDQEIFTAEHMDSVFGIYGTADRAVTSFSKNEQSGREFPNASLDVLTMEKIRSRSKSLRSMLWKTTGEFKVPVQGDSGYAKRWHYTLESMLSGNPNAKMKFATKVEADNFVKTTTTAAIYKFMYVMDDNAAIPAHLPFLGEATNPRTGLKGYQGEWTDEDLYQLFEITDEEKAVIEETMAKYK